jgi:hypothetical protein
VLKENVDATILVDIRPQGQKDIEQFVKERFRQRFENAPLITMQMLKEKRFMSQFRNFLVFAKDAETAREKAHVLMGEIQQSNNQHCLDDDDYLCWRDPVGDKRKDAILQVSTEQYPCDDKRGLERVNQAMISARENFKKNLVCIKYLANRYSDSNLFESEYTYVKETEIEFDGQKVDIYDRPSEFWHYCRAITDDNESGLYNLFAAPIGNPSQLNWILEHNLDLPHVLTFGVDRNGNRVCRYTRNPEVEMPLWIVMIELFSSMEIGLIEPEPKAPIAILVNASDAESALKMAEEATKKIKDFEHCSYAQTNFEQPDGRIVPSVAQVSTPGFPVEDQTGLDILREYLKMISSAFIHDVTELRHELASYGNEDLLNDAQGHSGKLRFMCSNLANGSQDDKTFLYEADYCIGGIRCHRVIKPKYFEDRLTRKLDGNGMCTFGLYPFNKPFWIVFFQVQENQERDEMP